MGSLSPPATPDPSIGIGLGNQVSQQQQNYNVASQAGSLFDQSNPYGNLNYQQTGTGPNGVPTYSATVSLTPQQQRLFNQYQKTQAMAGAQGQDLLTNANYGASNPSDVIGNMTSGNTQQMLQSEVNYLNPFFNQQTSQLDAQLRNQGLQPGQPAYDNAMRNMTTSQDLDVSNFLAQAEPQAFSQATQEYTLPLSISSQLTQLGAPGNATSQLVQNPQLGSVNDINAVGTENSAEQAQYNAQLAQYQAMMSGLFGIGSAALGGLAQGGGLAGGAALLGLSDAAVKQDVTPIKTLPNGIIIYRFRYLGGGPTLLGVIAQQVAKYVPKAVVRGSDGLLRVNYGLLGVPLLIVQP